MVQQAKEMLAQKLGNPIEQIVFFDILAVEWPNSSLGCPRPGIFYTEVITPGYKIQLESKGFVYTVHSDLTDQVVLCNVEEPHEIYHPP